MKTRKEISALIRDNRPALVASAEEYLKQWRGKRDVVYYLCDQDYLDTLLQEVICLTDDETMLIGEADINSFGEVDIWIDAAKNLGFTDYVSAIEDFKKDGP